MASNNTFEGIKKGTDDSIGGFEKMKASAKSLDKQLGGMSGLNELNGQFVRLKENIATAINPIKMLTSKWDSLIDRYDTAIDLNIQFGEKMKKVNFETREQAFKLGIAYADLVKGQTTLLGVVTMSEIQTKKYTAEMAYLHRATNVSIETFGKLAGEAEGFNESFSEKNLRNITESFSRTQKKVGLTNEQMELLVTSATTSVHQLSAFGNNTKAINSVTKATANLSAMYKRVGLDINKATQLMERFLDPDKLEDNSFLMSQMGMSFGEYVDMLEGGDSEAIMAKMSAGLYDAAQKAKEMSFFQKKAYAETLGVSVQELTRLGKMTREEFEASQSASEDTSNTIEDNNNAAMEKMRVMMTQNNEAILKIGDSMLQVFGGFIRDFSKTIREAIYGVIDDFWARIAAGESWVTVLFDKIKNGFKMAWEWIVKTTGAGWEMIAMLVVLGGVLIYLIPKISGFFTGLVGKAFDIIGKGIVTIMKSIGVGAQAMGAGMTAGALGILIFVAALTAIALIVRYLVVPAINLFLEGLSKFIVEVMPSVILLVKELGSSFTSIIEATAKPIEALGKAFTSLGEVLKPIKDILLGIMSVVEKFIDSFVELARIIGSAVEKAFSSVADIFSDVRGSLEAIPEIIKAISSASPSSLTSLVTMANNMYKLAEGIKEVAEASGEMSNAWSNLGKATVKNGKIEMVAVPSDEMKNIFDKGKDSIKVKLEEVVNLLKDIKGAKGSNGLYKMVEDTARIKNIQGFIATQGDKTRLENVVGFEA